MRIKEDRKQKKRFGKDAYVFIALSLISFSILLFSTRSFIASVRDAGLSAFSGIRGGIHSVSSFISRTVLSVQELATLRREYAELADRVTRYEQLERSSAEIRQENNRLREQLGFSNTIRYRHIPAELIGKDPDNLFSAFVINKGTRDGVAVDMPVIAFQNGTQALVGKVIQAGLMESLIMPLYDSNAYISGRLAESRYEGILEGQGTADLPLVMRFIRKRARDEISIGDIVVTSGLGGIYPQGITIGRVSRVIYQEYETSMGLELEPSIDFSRLEYIFVIGSEEER
ncbi:rod shape-determining protein MreC [Breznakiella homolactica]|uniref:Cell shape-determining protein MreC n=1 Tax=Breznakiella homolactica TaxID=2798577 RepID=A0A7T7XL19_9SPIR|nr:rod shape-determining protein MreC [Breznakiella homolactica]QQO08158.1 rod shape-determining protein MreC [Breznakiella homolactica]